MLSRLLYDLAIRLLLFGIYIASFIKPKARLWIRGRQNLFTEISKKLEAIPSDSLKVWMHCASLGEFEQGRPVVEQLKKSHPELSIIISFFSPSGFEVRKNYPLADIVCYLPADTRENARRFINTVQPDLAIFVKYEFWYHHLDQLNKRGTPTLLISALFRSNQVFFKLYGGFFRRMLSNFQHIFVQNQQSGELLEQIDKKQYSFGGDSRVDRVADIASAPNEYPLICQFLGESKVLVAGSTWPPDEKILTTFINQHLEENWKVIWAPHQIDSAAIDHLSQRLKVPTVRYSKLQSANSGKDFRVLFIDNVGMLAHLYQYGTLAYIGGGFGAGIHNTLEPIAFGLPLFFGPKYQKFEEANYLVENGAALVVRTAKDIRQGFEKWSVESVYENASHMASTYIKKNRGASEKIVQYVSTLLKK